MKMRKYILETILVIALSLTVSSLWARKSSDKVKSEITEALKTWNAACKSANIDLVMSMLDTTDGLMVVGSADGEINKGKEEVKAWISQIFGFAGFSWEMTQIDIDSNGKTAWVFVDGKMIVEFDKGGKKVTAYRFTGILVKKSGVWKWRLFDGSVPQQE
jgi:ketosteroid isomerase-like protein